jgi:hypothetical protein
MQFGAESPVWILVLEAKAKKDNGSPVLQPQIDYHLFHVKGRNYIINIWR